MTARLTIKGQDVSCFIDYDLTVDVGRADIEEQPDGSVLNCTMFGYLDAGQVGDPIQLDDSQGVLFHGIITDLTADFDDTLAWVTKISAVGPLAWLGQIQGGAAGYPAETDTQRIGHVLAESGLGYRVQQSPDVLNLLAREPDPQPAAEIAREAATDGMGVLWENPADLAAPIVYTPHALRKWAQITPLPWENLPPDLAWITAGTLTWGTVDTGTIPSSDVPTVELDPCKVPAQATFQQSIADLVRQVTVVYGLEATPQTSALLDEQPGLDTFSAGPLHLRNTYRVTMPEAKVAALRFYRHAAAASITRELRLVDSEEVVKATVVTAETAGYEGWVTVPLDELVTVKADETWHVEYLADSTFHFSAQDGETDPDQFQLTVGSYSTDGVAWVGTQLSAMADLMWQHTDAEATRPSITKGTQPPAGTYETNLAGLADANTYGESMLRRHQDPAWRLSTISIDLATLPNDEANSIRRALKVGARLVVPFPLGSPVGLLWQGFIEGWKHHLVSQGGATSHIIDFNASERRLTEAAERWKDASPTTRWADTGALKWQTALDVP